MSDDRPNTLERCDVVDEDELEPDRSITIIPQANEQQLSSKEIFDYYEYRKDFLTWLYEFGKNPEKAKGYSPYTVYATSYRAARFDRHTWDEHGRYHVPPGHEDAQSFMRSIALSDRSDAAKGKALEMLRRYSRWLTDRFGHAEWTFQWDFTSSGDNNQPRDFLSIEERRKIRRAALGMDGNPAYGVDNSDALAATNASWKYTSLVWTSLDAGLRPVEVGNARVSWVDVENEVLRIPRDESAKNVGNWTVSLTSRTARALDRWLQERREHPRYANTDALWLTRSGNRYGANQLRRLLLKLCDSADIPHSDRKMSWYTIRHSVGTYMTDERDLAAAKAQLRHKSPKTTMKYDQVPVEDRRDALDKMG